jgi:hypothetical protein
LDFHCFSIKCFPCAFLVLEYLWYFLFGVDLNRVWILEKLLNEKKLRYQLTIKIIIRV